MAIIVGQPVFGSDKCLLPDFKLLASKLDKYNKNTMFLPEVWQGHKNSGEGFWKALEFLEGIGF